MIININKVKNLIMAFMFDAIEMVSTISMVNMIRGS